MSTIHAIAGCMFAGKSTALIEIARESVKIYGQHRVQVYKPIIDTRYALDDIVSHTGEKMSDIPVSVKAIHIDRPINDPTFYNVIIVDEAQFFSDRVINELMNSSGAKVVFGGLDLDSFGRPFGSMPKILCMADHVTKLVSECVKCHGVATRTYRASKSTETVLIGGSGMFEPRCVSCWKDS